MFSKRWVRLALKLVVACLVLCSGILLFDFYLNFLPATVQAHLPHHIKAAVVVDVDFKSCWRASQCPDGDNGWYKHPKNLYLGQNWFKKTYLYTKRVQETELNNTLVLLDLRLSEEGPTVIPYGVLDDITMNNPEIEPSVLHEDDKTKDLAHALGWKLINTEFGVWGKFGKFVPGSSISELKVLFGESATYPIPGWTVLDGYVYTGKEPLPRLAVRKGAPRYIETPSLAFKDGKFKIVQLADLHMSTDEGVCDHPVGLPANEVCRADQRTMEFIDEVLEAEKPDFVIYTGDQIMGDRAPDPETAMLKALGPTISRKIPWALVLGNHDNQGPLNNTGLMNLVTKLPYSLAQFGPSDVDGVGNYVLTADINNHPALTMYFVDTHSSVKVKGKSQYDWIRNSQLTFVQDEFNRLKPDQDKYAHIPLSMAFFHIPLPEYRDTADRSRMVGLQREAVIAPTHNSHALEVFAKIGVSAMSVGHDHCNDYCLYHDTDSSPVWMCYGGGTGEGGYGGYPQDGVDTQRRIRVFEVNAQESAIYSWKRLRDTSELLDKQQLVKDGEAFLQHAVSN